MSGKVVDCFAHDGTNETTQRLLDEEGCPLDESIMTSLERIRDEEEHSNEISWDESEESGSKASRTPKSGPKNERTRKKAGQETEDGRHDVELVPEEAGPADQETMLHVLGTIFAAFKFPDTANLHLKCTLQVCTKLCPAVSATFALKPAILSQEAASFTLMLLAFRLHAAERTQIPGRERLLS